MICTVADIVAMIIAPEPQISTSPIEAEQEYLGVDPLGAHMVTLLKSQGLPPVLGLVQVLFGHTVK